MHEDEIIIYLKCNVTLYGTKMKQLHSYIFTKLLILFFSDNIFLNWQLYKVFPKKLPERYKISLSSPKYINHSFGKVSIW